MDRLEQAAATLGVARKVALLTGAGMSAESGIRTFRGGMDALWKDFDPMTLATPEAFAADPETVTRWYDWRRGKCLEAEPNAGHIAIAHLERTLADRGGVCSVLTQNVDGLHKRAGSERVIELHGSIMRWRGVRTGHEPSVPDGPFDAYPPLSEDGESLRPCVVWFGEALPTDAVEAAHAAASDCEVFLTIGTSAAVYPAAGFIDIASAAGATTIEVNPDDTEASNRVDLVLRGTAAVALPELVRRAFA
ncbi:MAG: NAD-dependent deacylase [Planctomycetota bacterium]